MNNFSPVKCAPNRLSHWFSQSPGISSGKLASSEDSHGSRQARSADYGDSFTKLHFPRIPRKLAPITTGFALRGFSRRYYFIIRERARERASPSPAKSLVLFNLRNNTMIRRQTTRSFIRRDREFFHRVSKVAANLLTRIASFWRHGSFRGLSIKWPFSEAWLTRLKLSQGTHSILI